MDTKRLQELVELLEQQSTQADKVLQEYTQGQTSIEPVAEAMKQLNETEGQFSVEVGSIVRDYWRRVAMAKKVRIDRNITELGFTP